ncbi:MAG: RDD family protein [Alcanivoracaceae bacterium]|nr:RDD family protein [Alcanivoracaceae bacterium]
MSQDWINQDLPPAGLGRRLIALTYDAFLIAAIWFITGGIWVVVYPYTGLPTESINGVVRASPEILHGIFFPLMMLEAWAFYAWFWLHGGQTLGMRAWKVMSRDVHRRPMKLWQTVVRFLAGFFSWGALGGGYLLALSTPYQTLHDKLSATETVIVPKAG